MALSYKIYDFPTLSVKEQLFYSPSQAFEGGFTSGGAAMFSPEPGGRAMMEIQLGFQVNEWDAPLTSWLMSKLNGQLFRYRMVPTPQLVIRKILQLPNGQPWNNGQSWNNGQNWGNIDLRMKASGSALKGSLSLEIDTISYGKVLSAGHVIGHDNYAYMIDEITYNSDNTRATILVSPPFRKSVTLGDQIFLRPYFVGRISNGDEIKATYNSENVGHIQPGRIVLSEAVV